MTDPTSLAGATADRTVDCPACKGEGGEWLAGACAHPTNWYECKTCHGAKVVRMVTFVPTSTEEVAEALGQVHCTGHVDYAPETRKLVPVAFMVGDKVRKVTGEYHINGEVRSVFTKADGTVRLVVEHNAEGGGSFLHIYGEANLELISE